MRSKAILHWATHLIHVRPLCPLKLPLSRNLLRAPTESAYTRNHEAGEVVGLWTECAASIRAEHGYLLFEIG